MAPGGGGGIWHGSPGNPHTTENIKTTKSWLADGYRVAFREGGAVWARQGPEGRKRTAPFGVLLSVISDAQEHSDWAKKIDREKVIYLCKSGDNHANYASFHQYKLSAPANVHCVVNAPISGSPSRFIANATALTDRSLRALSYGGGGL